MEIQAAFTVTPPPRGQSEAPASFGYNQTTMNKYLQELKDKGLVPLRLDNNTVLWVTPDKANEKYKTRYLKNAERSRRLALNLD